jgi:hypothetical protein
MAGFSFVSRNNSALTQLTSPSRGQQSVGQTHAAGNLLVACIHSRQGGTSPIASISNTAGDLWSRSVNSPYEDYPTGIHYFENWYVLSTKGALNDQLTLAWVGAIADPPDTVMTVYEFHGGGQTMVYTNVDGYGGLPIDFFNGGQGFLVSSVMTITAPSVVVAHYRSVSGTNPPVNPSGIQFAGIDDTSGIPHNETHYDSYQFTSVSGTAHASYTGTTDPQWGILASVFALGPALPVGMGCPQDLPPAASTGGVGCAADLGTVALPGGV